MTPYRRFWRTIGYLVRRQAALEVLARIPHAPPRERLVTLIGRRSMRLLADDVKRAGWGWPEKGHL